MKKIATLFGGMLIFSTIFVPNLSHAGGGGAAAAAGGMADEALKSQSAAAEMMFRDGINSKVFQKADEFLKEKFPGTKSGYWEAKSSGFVRCFSYKFCMALRWNGRFEVLKDGFIGSLVYEGDWTKWLK